MINPKVLNLVNPMQKVMSETPICIICLSKDKPLEKFQGSCKCRPDVHIKCIDTWLTTNGRTCPICRQKYPETDIQKKENETNRLNTAKEQEDCAACVLCTYCCYVICMPMMQVV